MKKLLIICFAALATAAIFTSCKESKGKVLDPLAKISIRAAANAQGVASKAAYLSPVEVVRLTTDIVMVSPHFPDEPWVNLGISDEQKDLTTPKIMLWGMWVVNEGKLNLNFLESKDMILVTRLNQEKWQPISDTLAYIPNAKLREAEKAIKAAYALEDYNLVYKLFDEMYQFTPINGADWWALKAQNKN